LNRAHHSAHTKRCGVPSDLKTSSGVRSFLIASIDQVKRENHEEIRHLPSTSIDFVALKSRANDALQLLYFTEQPYGLLLGVATAFWALMSVSAARTSLLALAMSSTLALGMLSEHKDGVTKMQS
jgi:hypothetical protein